MKCSRALAQLVWGDRRFLALQVLLLAYLERLRDRSLVPVPSGWRLPSRVMRRRASAPLSLSCIRSIYTTNLCVNNNIYFLLFFYSAPRRVVVCYAELQLRALSLCVVRYLLCARGRVYRVCPPPGPLAAGGAVRRCAVCRRGGRRAHHRP
jgi:hypothetical protein